METTCHRLLPPLLLIRFVSTQPNTKRHHEVSGNYQSFMGAEKERVNVKWRANSNFLYFLTLFHREREERVAKLVFPLNNLSATEVCQQSSRPLFRLWAEIFMTKNNFSQIVSIRVLNQIVRECFDELWISTEYGWKYLK